MAHRQLLLALTPLIACGVGGNADVPGPPDVVTDTVRDATALASDQQAPVQQGAGGGEDDGIADAGAAAPPGTADGGYGDDDAPSGEANATTGSPKGDGAATTESDGAAACGDLYGDTHNCGACGHDCQGGDCTAGACQPVVIYAGLIGVSDGMNYPWGLAVDDTNVYWTDNMQGGIWVAPKSGASMPSVLATDTGPTEVTVDATSVYWTDQEGRVLKAPLQGGSPVTLTTSTSETDGIVVDSTSVYFTTAGAFDGLVSQMALDGTSEQTLASAQGDPLSLALYGSTLFWANDEPFYDSTTQEEGDEVASVPIDGGSIFTIASGDEGVTQVAVDSTSVYWTTGAALMKSAWDGGSPNTLGTGCSAIAVDETGVYCATGTLITRVPLSGGMPTTVADFASFAYGYTIPARKIVLDETTVYWVVPWDALVMKVAK